MDNVEVFGKKPVPIKFRNGLFIVAMGKNLSIINIERGKRRSE